jgi:hypothetical protein
MLTFLWLQEVLDLTEELIRSQDGATAAAAVASESTAPTELSSEPASSAATRAEHSWKVGDRCIAIWSEDQKYVCYK